MIGKRKRKSRLSCLTNGAESRAVPAKKQSLSFNLELTGRRGGGISPLLLRYRQQTFRRDTLVRHHAEQPARRHARVVRKHLEMATRREALPQLPVTDRDRRNAQIRGDLLQRDVVCQSPVAERGRKTGADVTMELGLLSHSESLPETLSQGMALKKASLDCCRLVLAADSRFELPRAGASEIASNRVVEVYWTSSSG